MAVRQFQIWTGNSKFFCRGFIMTGKLIALILSDEFDVGPNSYAWIITFILILIMSVMSDATTVYYVSQRSTFVLYVLMVLIQLLTLICLVITSLMDPGYLPRRNFVRMVKSDNSEMNAEDQAIPFHNKYIFYQARMIKLKY